MDFATKIKAYRRMLNATQNDIAAALGIDRSTYAYYETGKTLPSSDSLRILSNLFGVPIKYLLEEKQDKPPLRFSSDLVLNDIVDDLLDNNKPFDRPELNFSDLSPDEKELIALYRIKKATKERQLYPSAQKDMIRHFLQQYKP